MSDLGNSKADEQPNFSDRSPGDSGYQEAMDLAREVIELAETHQTPPVPKVFEVWYSYAAGSDDVIKNRVDAAIENRGSLKAYEIDQIHSEFFSFNETQRKGHDATGLKLDKEMGEIIELVQSYQVSSENYTGSLIHTVEALSDAAKPAQVRKTIELLIAENAMMKSETADLTDNLEQSKAQIQKMRTELARSRENEMRDPLTELGNRRCLEASLVKEFANANEQTSPLCLVLTDIDQFKRVNDTYGHLIGDEVIKFFALLLTKNTKDTNICVRYGGEEFAIVLPSTDIANAEILIEHIRVHLEKTNLVISKSQKSIGSVTASFGIAQFREKDTPQTLLRRADANLFEAKNSGRNRTVCDDKVIA